MHPIIVMADLLHLLLANAGSRTLHLFTHFAQAAAPVAVTALWQGLAIAAVLALCMRLAPRVSASQRFGLWAAAFAFVAALPFWPLLAHASAASITPASSLGSIANKAPFQLDSRWAFAVAALWLLASVYRAADLAFHSLRLRKLWRSATPVPVDSGLRSLLAAVSPRRRSIQICTTCLLDRPSVIGFFAPRILIPNWLFQRLTPGELEHVVLHETEHLRRRDDWTNLLQKLSLVLFPLNPALAWIEHRLCREREMACDEGVVRRTQAPRAYAACLTSLAERSLKRRAEALSLGAWQRRPELVRRVHTILWRKQSLHPVAARALVGVVGCGLLFSSVELARCPQMVAFVPARTPGAQHAVLAASHIPSAVARHASSAQVHNVNLALGAAQYHSNRFNAASRFRAIDTRAIMSTSSTNAVAQSATASLHPGAAREIASRELPPAPHQVLLKAESPSSTSAPAQPAQFVVFTAWEQVDTPIQNGRTVADYDTAPAQQSAKLPTGSASQPTAHVTVTRLFLAVYPVSNSPAAKTPGVKTSKTPVAGLPTAVPFDGGWLVFEL